MICISEATQADLEKYMATIAEPEETRPWTRSVHLGSDLESGAELPHTAVTDEVVAGLDGRPFLLAIGTLEPRKDHATIVAAFEKLWATGEDVALVIDVVADQPWPHGSLVIRGVALAQVAAIVSFIIRMIRAQRPQPVRGQ